MEFRQRPDKTIRGKIRRDQQQEQRRTTVCTATSGTAAPLDNSIRKTFFAKYGRLSRMNRSCFRSDLRGIRRAFCRQRPASAPYKLQSRENSHHGNRHFQFVRRNFPRQQASQHYSRNATHKKLSENRQADRAETPVKNAADDRQDKSKQQVRAHHLGGRHLGIVEQQHSSESASARGRKSRFDSDRQSEPGKPAMVFPRE